MFIEIFCQFMKLTYVVLKDLKCLLMLKDLCVEEGDTIEEGSVLGYINETTKYYSKEGSNLYFAMKKDGKPIDPIAYLP